MRWLRHVVCVLWGHDWRMTFNDWSIGGRVARWGHCRRCGRIWRQED